MCSDACLHEENVEQMVRCIRLDRDCAAICRLAAEAMVRGSEMAARIGALCAETCAACAEACARHADHHDHCRVCAGRAAAARKHAGAWPRPESTPRARLRARSHGWA